MRPLRPKRKTIPPLVPVFPGSGALGFRPCLKIGNMPNSEGFFRLTRRFDKENQCSMTEKDSLFGHVDIFQTWPGTEKKGRGGGRRAGVKMVPVVRTYTVSRSIRRPSSAD